MPELLEIPTVETVHRQNVLCGRKRTLQTQAGSTVINVVFQSESRCAPEALLAVEVEGRRLWVGLEDPDALPCESLNGLPISTLPKQLLLGVLETLFAPLLDSISRNAGPCRLIDWMVANEVDQQLPQQAFHLNHGDQVTHGVIIANETALQFLAEHIALQPETAAFDVNELPLAVSVELGCTHLTAEQFGALKPHDVLMIEDTIGDPNTALARFPAPLPCWKVAVDGNTLRWVTPTADTQEAHGDGGKIVVTIRLAEFTVPANTCLTLQADDTLELGQTSVQLVVEGQPIGLGDLVEISGKPAVRIRR